MSNRFGDDTWSLIVPEGWRAWDNGSCFTLVSRGDAGAFQVSSAYSPDSEVLDRDLRDFACVMDGGCDVTKPVKAGDFIGLEVAYEEGGHYWRKWYLRNGHQMLFVTYNCDLEWEGLDDEEIEGVLASLRATETMGSRGSADSKEVEALLQSELAALHPAHRARFLTMRVPFRRVPVDAHPGESVVVVAEHSGRILYYSEVEDGWELTVPAASGGIPERGANQFQLSHIMWQLFGDPELLS